ncbi:GTP cyclohydrolase 1 [Candidatus Photodesmus katoptron]|uniref:GTP cyclohydrolase 1 n=1 Tax=Candidatus Photodesmus katoptron Akat1 TaxID=1236703 RepID=S3EHE1_9GAMM|nr:GTP cyclohydrolase I FolE [Candidatus Photodesmus katoptron]EPE37603.1 GTP cyclohydrolase I [Candidatus Photodesmus katoptron Akat1]KEY90678.1 GTP cyclohydrolase 1 [Candidatus Photodesmus katoptron]
MEKSKTLLDLSRAAKLVKNALESSGLETPMSLDQLNLNYKVKKEKIEYHIREVLGLLGLNLMDDSLKDTPFRVASMYMDEVFSGLYYQNFPKITLIENKMNITEMVFIKNISLTSTCEHHFITIDGKAAIGYVPKRKIIGLSKINRIVHFFSKRPQVQERMTEQILLALQTLLESSDVAVVIDAVHYCVKSRGIVDVTSETSTTALGGIFKKSKSARQEFFNKSSTK